MEKEKENESNIKLKGLLQKEVVAGGPLTVHI